MKAAGKAAIDANFTRYTVSQGIPELRQAICDRYKKDYGIETTPAEVIVTNGGKQSVYQAFQTVVNPGDEVVFADGVGHFPNQPLRGDGDLVGSHSVIGEEFGVCLRSPHLGHPAIDARHPSARNPV